MISIKKSRFFLPTTLFRRLTILLALSQQDGPSQHKIARAANLSGAMVNGYIKEMAGKALIEISKRNKRDLNYRLTPAGRSELSSLLMRYSAEIVQLYSQAKAEIIDRLSAFLPSDTRCRAVLFGASETCEMVLQGLAKFPEVEIAGIIDNNIEKQNSSFQGYRVFSPDQIEALAPDFIIITSFARQNEIYRSICHLEEKKIRIERLSVI